MIESTMKDSVAVLAMRHGKANALDTELCQALCGALDDAAADGAAAVVLTGAWTMFRPGGSQAGDRRAGGYVAAFLPELRRAFTRLATFELPVVAAVNGHAIAGGFILSAAADWVVMAEGPGRAGVTELLVGVPFPAVALELLRLRAGDAQARPLALSGATFGAGEALARGLVDAAVPAAELAGQSLAAARAAGCPGPGVRPHQAPATAAVPRPRSRSGRPRRRSRCDLAGPAHPGAHPVLHDLAQVSRDPSKASTGMADKRIGQPAFRLRQRLRLVRGRHARSADRTPLTAAPAAPGGMPIRIFCLPSAVWRDAASCGVRS